MLALLLLACRPAPAPDLPAEAPVPASLPPLTVTISEPGSHVAEGFVLVTLVSPRGSHLAVADGAGDWVWGLEAPPDRTFAAGAPSLDGESLLFASFDRARQADDGVVVRVGWDGVERSVTPVATAHHMFAELEGGELAWLALDFRTLEHEGEVWDLVADRVLTAPEGGDDLDPAVAFSFFDDYGPYYVPCDHALLPIDRFGHQDHREWTHGNSLVHEPLTGAWYVNARHLDALLKIDAATGEVRWQLGGAYATLSVEDPALLPAHAHLSDAWPDGALIFDNGVHRDPPVSRVVRWRFDEDAGTATPEWVYEPPDGRFVHMLGDARRLPDGHVLVAWSTLGTLTELTPDGEVVWEATLPDRQIVGRVRFLEDLSSGSAARRWAGRPAR